LVSLFRFFEWLGNTSWSIAFHESRYVFLLVLMIHVLTLSVFVGTAFMIDLRLLGKTMTAVPVSQVMTRLMPWTEAGFLVMIVTGALLFYAAPVARYENSAPPCPYGGGALDAAAGAHHHGGTHDGVPGLLVRVTPHPGFRCLSWSSAAGCSILRRFIRCGSRRSSFQSSPRFI
jgi:hypothetical protein